MRKLVLFALSFSVSVILFLIVVATVLLLSGASGDYKGNVDGGTKLSVELPQEAVEVLVIYADGEWADVDFKICFATLNVCTEPDDFTARTLSLDANQQEEAKTLYENGFNFTLVDTVCRENDIQCQNFIMFDSESFAKIADRMNGVVYNEGGALRLLTGSQAADMMSDELLRLSCEQFWQTANQRNLQSEMLLLIELTENNLSYPKMYDTIF